MAMRKDAWRRDRPHLTRTKNQGEAKNGSSRNTRQARNAEKLLADAARRYHIDLTQLDGAERRLTEAELKLARDASRLSIGIERTQIHKQLAEAAE